jgi:hypothetical protein
MTTLHLGVNDIPYAPGPRAPRRATFRRGKGGGTRAASGQQTTFDVAQILEAKYGIMQVFWDRVAGPGAADALAESAAGALENLLAGAPASAVALTSDFTAGLETKFKDFLATRQVEGMGIQGVPTLAAIKGVNHRLRHPYAKANPRRPSFIDTGTYQANFRAWVD